MRRGGRGGRGVPAGGTGARGKGGGGGGERRGVGGGGIGAAEEGNDGPEEFLDGLIVDGDVDERPDQGQEQIHEKGGARDREWTLSPRHRHGEVGKGV